MAPRLRPQGYDSLEAPAKAVSAAAGGSSTGGPGLSGALAGGSMSGLNSATSADPNAMHALSEWVSKAVPGAAATVGAGGGAIAAAPAGPTPDK